MNAAFFNIETTERIQDGVPIDRLPLACAAVHLIEYRGNYNSFPIRKTITTDNLELLKICFDFSHAIVGFNVKAFDYTVLWKYYEDELIDEWRAKTLDVMDLVTREFGRCPSLNTLAQYTIGYERKLDWKRAEDLWRKGECDAMINYCHEDVRMTRDIFDYGMVHGIVRTLNHEAKDLEEKDLEAEHLEEIDARTWMWELNNKMERDIAERRLDVSRVPPIDSIER